MILTLVGAGIALIAVWMGVGGSRLSPRSLIVMSGLIAAGLLAIWFLR
jgi:hypothetical protein